MRKRRRSDVGITLIALIVTIIVMLILAGVTISIAMGDNGIIKRAKESGKRYQEAAVNETNQLGELEESINTLGEGTSSGGGATQTVIQVNGSLKYTVNGDKLLDNDGKEITDATAKKDALSAIYGQKVSYTSDSDSNTEIGNRIWRIFFIDFDGKYSTDGTKGTIYLKADYDSTKTITPGNYTGNEYMPTDTTVLAKMNPSWWTNRGQSVHIATTDTNTTNANNNERETAYLCNTAKFTQYVNSNANYAIGGPSVEMYCDSYNSVNHPSGGDVTTNYTLGVIVDVNGKNSGRSSTGDSSYNGYIYTLNGDKSKVLGDWYYTGNNTVDYANYNSMYCGKGGAKGSYYWWLASPSANRSNSMCYVNGYAAYLNDDDDSTYGFCPLVSLKSSIHDLTIIS